MEAFEAFLETVFVISFMTGLGLLIGGLGMYALGHGVYLTELLGKEWDGCPSSSYRHCGSWCLVIGGTLLVTIVYLH